MEFIGLDVHRHYTVYTRLPERGRALGLGRVANDEIGSVIGQFRPRRAVMEATGNWPHIAEQPEVVVEELVLAHPRRVKAIASARVKTDNPPYADWPNCSAGTSFPRPTWPLPKCVH